MPSFDVVSEVDFHELTNAVDQVRRELENRYDFRGTKARLEQNKYLVTLFGENEFQLGQLADIVKIKFAGRNIDVRSLEFGESESNVSEARQTVTVRQGISQEIGKKVVKAVKESKAKVQAAIQGDQVRITGKKRDDLQQVIALLKKGDFELPLQFINMRD